MSPAATRVQVFPSSAGTVLVVGVTPQGEWVAEFRCRPEDFTDEVVVKMEALVRRHERPGLAIVV